MINKDKLRPWGKLEWLFDKMPSLPWDFIGCLSTEERCIGAFEYMQSKGLKTSGVFWEILDPKDTTLHQGLRNKNKDKLVSLNSSLRFEEHSLMEMVHKIIESIEIIVANSTSNIVLDISAFPKRFFFPMTKILLEKSKVTNLIITYSSPESYTNESLAENPQGWNIIPPFISREDDDPEIAVVGVGFMPLGLPDFVGNDNKKNRSINLLFPFPPGPPYYQRTWNFVKKINDYRPIRTNELHRVDPMSIPEVFDKICAITDMGSRKAFFAPFGPKTISFAMCLHAFQTQSAVFYTQPTYYTPNYSSGYVETWGYCIKTNGNFLYNIY